MATRSLLVAKEDRRRTAPKSVDIPFLCLVLLLLGVGLLMLYSASCAQSQFDTGYQSTTRYLQKQAVCAALGLVAMCYGRVFTSVLCLALNTYYTNKLIGYGFLAQMKDLTHIIIHSLIMFGVVFAIMQWLPSLWLQLVIGIVVGVAYYVIGAYLMKFDELKEVMSILKLKRA